MASNVNYVHWTDASLLSSSPSSTARIPAKEYASSAIFAFQTPPIYLFSESRGFELHTQCPSYSSLYTPPLHLAPNADSENVG